MHQLILDSSIPLVAEGDTGTSSPGGVGESETWLLSGETISLVTVRMHTTIKMATDVKDGMKKGDLTNLFHRLLRPVNC